ncbi:MAG TPA: hypothetical protein VGM77_00565 [Gemmatimonadales bacterium]
MRWTGLAAAGLAAGTLMGCGARPLPVGARTSHDSAGVEVVELGPPDTVHQQWRVDLSAPLLMLGGSGDGTELFGKRAPRSAVTLPDGRLIVAFDEAPYLGAFDSTGRLVSRFGQLGGGPGEFTREPTVLAYGDTIVAEVELGGLAMVTFFGPDLKVAQTYHISFPPTPASEPFPIGVTAKAEIVFRHEYVEDKPGVSRAPAEILVAPWGGGRAHQVVHFAGEERMALANPMIRNTFLIFGKKSAMTMSGERLLSGGNDGFAIDTHDLSGKLIRTLRVELPATPVTQQMKDGWVADQFIDTTAETGRLAHLSVETAQYAKELRAYEGFYPTTDGGIWIERARLRDGAPHVYWAFDSTGHFLAATSLPVELKPREIWRDRVMVSGVDADGVPMLAIYRLVPVVQR